MSRKRWENYTLVAPKSPNSTHCDSSIASMRSPHSTPLEDANTRSTKSKRMFTRQFDALLSPRLSAEFVSSNRFTRKKKVPNPIPVQKSDDLEEPTSMKKVQTQSKCSYFLRNRDPNLETTSKSETVGHPRARLLRTNSDDLQSTTKDPTTLSRPITRAQAAVIGVQRNAEHNVENKSKTKKIASKSTIGSVRKPEQTAGADDKSKAGKIPSTSSSNGQNSNTNGNQSIGGPFQISFENSTKIAEELRFEGGKVVAREVSVTLSHNVLIGMRRKIHKDSETGSQK